MFVKSFLLVMTYSFDDLYVMKGNIYIPKKLGVCTSFILGTYLYFVIKNEPFENKKLNILES